VLVYLGDVPDYVQDNAINFNRIFKGTESIVITDSEKSFRLMQQRGIQTWLCSNQLGSNSEIVALSQHNGRFRDNFWIKTVLRFFAIAEYMRVTGESHLLHVEADVWLSKEFPVDKIEESATGLAYPLKSYDQGIASTVYIPDSETLDKLNTFIIESFRQEPYSTDVSILGKFHQVHPEYFFNFPTSIPSQEFFRSNIGELEQKTLSRNFDLFSGLFDASSLGIYFTGIDPRNNWGWRDLFVKLDHKIDFANVELDFANEIPLLRYKDLVTPIFSLHIHSKDRRFFDYSRSLKRLRFLAKQDQSRRVREFSLLTTPKIFIRTALIKFLLAIRDKVR